MKRNRVIILLICLTLVTGSIFPVYAIGGSKTVNRQPIYFAIGDSLAAGCKIPVNITGGAFTVECKQAAFDAFRTIASGGSKYDLFDNPVYGTKMNHWNINAVPYSYVCKFGTFISASEMSKNGVHPGLRAKELCYILGLINQSAYVNDKWKDLATNTCQLEELKNSAMGYKSGIRTADVITVELGENDFTAFFVNCKDELLDEINKLMKTATVNEKQVLEEMKDDVMEAQTKSAAEDQYVGTIKMLNSMSKLKKDSKTYTRLIDYLVKSIGKTMVETRVYWNKMMRYIYKNKKKNAIVIATTVPNPLKNAEAVVDTIKSDFIGVDLDMTAVAEILKLVIQPFISDINNVIKSSAYKYKYSVANINNVVLNNVATNEEDAYDNVKLGDKVYYIVHPSHDEQTKIYKAIRNTYIKEKYRRCSG